MREKLTEYVTLRMTRGKALEMGLLCCESCGHPVNNHFDWDGRPCAHCKECKGYVEQARSGMILVRK